MEMDTKTNDTQKPNQTNDLKRENRNSKKIETETETKTETGTRPRRGQRHSQGCGQTLRLRMEWKRKQTNGRTE